MCMHMLMACKHCHEYEDVEIKQAK